MVVWNGPGNNSGLYYGDQFTFVPDPQCQITNRTDANGFNLFANGSCTLQAVAMRNPDGTTGPIVLQNPLPGHRGNMPFSLEAPGKWKFDANLSKRFRLTESKSLLFRLDQALGWLEEKVTPRLPLAEHVVERRFPEPIGLIEDVLLTAHDLAVTLNVRLEASGIGAQTFHLLLYRVDHKVMTLSVNSARPSRDPDHIAKLFSHRAERLAGEYDAGFGIDMIRLAVSSVDKLDGTQLGAFATPDGTDDLAQLQDRMSSRLGAMAVLRTQFVATHIPERAARLVPAMVHAAGPQAEPGPDRDRPLRLLPVPEPIAINAEVPDGLPASMIWRRISYRITRASGPERLGAEWWRSGQRLQLAPPEPPRPAKPGETPRPPPHVPRLERFNPSAVTRDYYIAEDAMGRRFWIFREGLYHPDASPVWYLHGLFA